MPVAHGRRAIETIRMFATHVTDPEAEARWLEEAERLDLDGLVEIPGARALIASLPPDSWALVTSADAALARSRLEACGLPVPRVFITANRWNGASPIRAAIGWAPRGWGSIRATASSSRMPMPASPPGARRARRSSPLPPRNHPRGWSAKGELWVPDLGGLRVRRDGDLMHLTHI